MKCVKEADASDQTRTFMRHARPALKVKYAREPTLPRYGTDPFQARTW